MTLNHIHNCVPRPARLHLLLLCFALFICACGSAAESRPAPDPTLMAPFLDRNFSGELVAIGGEARETTLTLMQGAEGDYEFSLDFLYVGRSLRPTNRTGLWYFDGSTLTLDIVEQDGEPVDQPSLVFAIAGDQLLGTIFDKTYFDVEDLLLSEMR